MGPNKSIITMEVLTRYQNYAPNIQSKHFMYKPIHLLRTPKETKINRKCHNKQSV